MTLEYFHFLSVFLLLFFNIVNGEAVEIRQANVEVNRRNTQLLSIYQLNCLNEKKSRAEKKEHHIFADALTW